MSYKTNCSKNPDIAKALQIVETMKVETSNMLAKATFVSQDPYFDTISELVTNGNEFLLKAQKSLEDDLFSSAMFYVITAAESFASAKTRLELKVEVES